MEEESSKEEGESEWGAEEKSDKIIGCPKKLFPENLPLKG